MGGRPDRSRHGEADQAGSEAAFDPRFEPLTHGTNIPDFDNWLVVHTPGHTLDSCCYFHQPSRSLISGDTLLGSGRTNRLVLPAIYRDRDRLERSIEALNRLNPAAVYPGHGSSLKGQDLVVNLLKQIGQATGKGARRRTYDLEIGAPHHDKC